MTLISVKGKGEVGEMEDDYAYAYAGNDYAYAYATSAPTAVPTVAPTAVRVPTSEPSLSSQGLRTSSTSSGSTDWKSTEAWGIAIGAGLALILVVLLYTSLRKNFRQFKHRLATTSSSRPAAGDFYWNADQDAVHNAMLLGDRSDVGETSKI